MKSNLKHWALCWGIFLMGAQAALAQGIPSLPNSGSSLMARYQGVEPPPLPTEAPPPVPPGAMPSPPADPYSGGGMSGQDYGISDNGMYPGVVPSEGAGVSCTSGICDDCYGGCAPGGRMHLFGSMEYMMMWTNGQYYPVLATTSPANTPRTAGPGILGQAGVPLFGGDEINTDQKNGGRITFGAFLDPECNVAWVNRFTAISLGTNRFAASSANGEPTLARPFVDVRANPRGENALLLSYFDPTLNQVFSNGSIDVQAGSNVMLAETYLKTMMHNDGQLEIDLLAGFHYTRVDNDISIQSIHTVFNTPAGAAQFNIHDLIQAKNNFYGGVVGFQAEKRYGRFSVNALLKSSFGVTQQAVHLHGAQTLSATGASIAVPGAFYVQKSNAGASLDTTYSRDVFSVVPEVNFTLGYWLTPHLQATLGYSAVYWTNQVQAGDVIDTRINFSQQAGNLQGVNAPTFQWRDGDFWMQGMTVGLNLDF